MQLSSTCNLFTDVIHLKPAACRGCIFELISEWKMQASLNTLVVDGASNESQPLLNVNEPRISHNTCDSLVLLGTFLAGEAVTAGTATMLYYLLPNADGLRSMGAPAAAVTAVAGSVLSVVAAGATMARFGWKFWNACCRGNATTTAAQITVEHVVSNHNP
jgi:hypothetical protein